MKINRIHIENFGGFSDFNYSFSDGYNWINRENGWGKTTLSVFIRSMFYGFPQKGETAKDRERYRPWGNGIYGGNLTFSIENHMYTIYRVFGKSKTGGADEFHLVDEETRKECFRWSQDIGEELFGINEESFTNTAWIRMEGCSVNSDITSKLGNQPGILEDMKRFDVIMINLEKRLNHLSPGRKTGLIYRKKIEKQELETELLRIPLLEQTIRTLEEEKGGKLEQLKALEQEQKKMQHFQKECSNWQDFARLKEVHETLQKEYLRRDEIWEIQQEKFPEGIPEKKDLEEWFEGSGIDSVQKNKDEKEKTRDLPVYRENVRSLLLGFLLLLTGLLFVFNQKTVGIVSFIIGFVLLGRGVWQLVQHSSNESGSFSKEWNPEQFRLMLLKQREVETARTAWEELQKADRELRDFYRKYPDFEERLKKPVPEFLRGNTSFSEINNRVNSLNETIQTLGVELQELFQKTEILLEERSSLTEKEEKLAVLKDQLEKLEKEYWLTAATAEYLTRAKEAFSAKFMTGIQRAFQGYYQLIDPDQRVELFIDSSFNICTMGGGIPRAEDVLSRGYRNLAELCLRFSLLDAMFEKELPCIIMDDPLANFDDEKYIRTVELLKQVSERYQLICFSCSSER